MRENFWASVYGTGDDTAVFETMYNKYIIWDVLVTNEYQLCASDYSLVTA